jgi:hypothetical protein
VLVVAAITAGLECHRRYGASPWALLQIEKVQVSELVAAEAAK